MLEERLNDICCPLSTLQSVSQMCIARYWWLENNPKVLEAFDLFQTEKKELIGVCERITASSAYKNMKATLASDHLRGEICFASFCFSSLDITFLHPRSTWFNFLKKLHTWNTICAHPFPSFTHFCVQYSQLDFCKPLSSICTFIFRSNCRIAQQNSEVCIS